MSQRYFNQILQIFLCSRVVRESGLEYGGCEFKSQSLHLKGCCATDKIASNLASRIWNSYESF